MSQLHVYFLLRQQQAFRRQLDTCGSNARAQSSTRGLSSSGGKSWNKKSPLGARSSVDVNARDPMGRTVLHLAAAAQDPAATEYVRMLLAHPDILVNFPDKESHWTALHRALYHGNIATAVVLLQRTDIDPSVRDCEGYTAFDLYNSTLEGTKPDTDDTTFADLFTWGVNRNATLGLENGDDRLFPEQVVIRPPEDVPENEHIDVRFSSIHVGDAAMSRLHTAVITSEDRGNLRVCGFGNGGRLGPGQHTQYGLVPLPQLSHTIVSIALGQDHTLALTKSGEVLSWGLNRFAQLGYVVDQPASAGGLGRSEEPIQATPRKVAGPLKNKRVLGVAACKTASACWTEAEVYTWGTNNGQLGYDKSAQPVQVLPRVVTKVSQPVISVSITDNALVCLLVTNDVVCLWNDRHSKVNFPAHAFPSEITVYRPPQAVHNTSIRKITNCDNTIAALSTNGEVFTFTVPAPSDASSGTDRNKGRNTIVPQRVWALRKKVTAVRDVALGADGSLIVCTESGHVFVRARVAKAGQGAGTRALKFQQVPYIQRAVRVYANATGSYAALRVEHRPPPIKVAGHTLAQDMAEVQPYMRHRTREAAGPEVNGTGDHGKPPEVSSDPDDQLDEEGEDLAIQRDIKQIELLCGVLETMREQGDSAGLYDGRMPFGADLLVQVGSAACEFPAHRVVLAARSAPLRHLLASGTPVQDTAALLTAELLTAEASASTHAKLGFAGCQPLSVLILLAYLYSDDPPALWDPRVGPAVGRRLVRLGSKPEQVKAELKALARMLQLPLLADVLDAPVKRLPKPSMGGDMRRLFEASQSWGPALARSPDAPDVVLRLADRDVYAHSTILRARSSFFATFFDDEDWTRDRWTPEGMVVVDLKHLRWREMEYVTRFLCCDGDQEMFDVLEQVHSVDEMLDFMFEVLSAANELLIDQLILLCCSVILKYVSVWNACSVLSDASHYNAAALVDAVHDYLAVNAETLLESRMLDDMRGNLVKQLSAFIRRRQLEKYPVSRSNKLVDAAMETHRAWLALQDIPQTIVPNPRVGALGDRDSAKLSPPGPMRSFPLTAHATSAPGSPLIRPEATAKPAANMPADDELFLMDEPDASPVTPIPGKPPAISAVPADSPRKPVGGWKATSVVPRVDMKAIMAEAETAAAPKRPAPIPVARVSSGGATPTPRGTPPRDGSKPLKPLIPPTATATPRTVSGSSWRIPSTAKPGSSPPNTAAGGSRPDASASLVAKRAPAVSRPQASTTPPTTPKKASRPPGLGPVITPTKQSAPSKSSPSAIRRVSSGSVWTPPPVQPVVQASSSTSAMSFAAIQELQREQNNPAKDKRSLVHIQEEERARQIEEDFLKWWATAEARLQEEQKASSSTAQAASRPRKSKKPKNDKNMPSTAIPRPQDSSQQIPGKNAKPQRNRINNKKMAQPGPS
ncbi:hypothetical protein POSPLADRAFT_1073959 [Postia placenta MAD-698-R-SB12]|uniref:BTB domain-containing protein n=1 Tax=Postia placenta MAD-698-R-SB12 TaxID=670580 RepID=A0A1X6N7W0_9APHY|nr:hypothetical protein POSPLADRAFT_1073959 [Postia placenta MAD-698-R-SB12]OSX64580.1 hypothetical protein POSPLADRAFT_1073959 [Postia placenta MAD-698-R-SB12]